MKFQRYANLLRGLVFIVFVALLLLFGPDPVYASDVPFSDEQTVDGDFGGAADVTTADLDGDGDLDILGAG